MKVVLIGANNPEIARVVRAVQERSPEFEVVGFLDNDPSKSGKSFVGYPVLGTFERLPELVNQGVYFVNLITRDCPTRHETSLAIAQAGGKFTNLVHPSVNLEMVELGVGNYIQENVVLQAGVKVGNNSSIHIGSLIGHETEVGHSVFIAHGCNISGVVKIEEGVFIGTGTSIVPRVTIGRWSVIGAGTVIIKDVPPYTVVVGNPGRKIDEVEHRHTLGDIAVISNESIPAS